MTTPMIGLVALLAIALIAWAIAELKNRSITFTHSEAEANGNKELNLKDLLARNSTKGYKSI